MPYIKQEDRYKFDFTLDTLSPETKGELEYCIFKLMVLYSRKVERNYSNLHDITYAAQHCADEFKRNFLDKREDEAKQENGDI